MNIKVKISNKITDTTEYERAIKIINRMQYNFVFETELFDEKSEVYSWNDFRMKNVSISDYCIFITDKKFIDNWFSHNEKKYAVISTNGWSDIVISPRLSDYIIYQISLAIIFFSMDIDENEAIKKKVVHMESRGCIFDMCKNKNDIILGMKTGLLCDDCKSIMERRRVEKSNINAIEKLLEYVRSAFIENEYSIDYDQAFIVMSFEKNKNLYLDIKENLGKIGINCVRADDSIDNNTIYNKVTGFIKKSNYIIVKIDDLVPNVYFELGYAKAIGKDVILIKEINETNCGNNIPLDINNLEHIEYSDFYDLKSKLLKMFKDKYNRY